MRKYYFYLGFDVGVSWGLSCVCICIFIVVMILFEVIGVFFYFKVDLYFVIVCIYLILIFWVYYDEGFWFFLY